MRPRPIRRKRFDSCAPHGIPMGMILDIRLGLLLVLAICLAVSPAATAAVLTGAEGQTSVSIGGVPSDGATKLNETLPAGAVVMTGGDGKALLRVAEGIFLELQGDTQLVIGATETKGAIDPASGESLPQTTVTLQSGSFVLLAAPESLQNNALLVVTPRGSLAPASSGLAYIAADSADPSVANVTVAAVEGSGVITTTAGEPVPLGGGMVAVLGSDGATNVINLDGFAQSTLINSTVQSAAASVGNLEPVSQPASLGAPVRVTSQTSTPSVTSSPTPRPRPSPSPSPSPAPSPLPSPSPSPTPRPRPSPSPSPSPVPSPSPSPTPRPRPSPSPSPTATPSPTQTPF